MLKYGSTATSGTDGGRSCARDAEAGRRRAARTTRRTRTGVRTDLEDTITAIQYPRRRAAGGKRRAEQHATMGVFQATRLAAAYDGIERLPVTVLLENVRSLYNVGAFFRTGDAVRVQKLLLAGITAAPPNRQIAKTALGGEATVAWERVEDTIAALSSLRAAGVQLAAVETSVRAVDVFDWQPSFPVCIAFGHEVDGLSHPVLDACDVHVRIPTLGLKQSLNVATAGGVVLYELLRKYRSLCAQ
jgi:tRNA G18 (ribose-2'-O)-methylase SpoU